MAGSTPGRKPLDSAIVAEVHRLLARGRLSQRKIARRLGISHGVVQNIAAGRWGKKPPGAAHYRRLKRPYRCKCGGLVRLDPCPLCEARRLAAIGNCALRPTDGRHYRQRG